MSYILDALKKSESWRQASQILDPPIGAMAPSPQRSETARRDIIPWVIALCATVVLVAFVTLSQQPVRTFLGMEMERRGGHTGSAGVKQALDEVPQGGEAGIEIRREVQAPRPHLLESRQPVPDPASTPKLSFSVDDPKSPQASFKSFEKYRGGHSQTTATDSKGVYRDEVPARVPALSALPARFQKAVPMLEVNVHAYAEAPDERFVLINLEHYGEGDRTEEGVLLEEITVDGVIARYHGRRFFLTP